jgi:hypothetical protein
MIVTSSGKVDGHARRDAALKLLEERRKIYLNRCRRVILLRLLNGATATMDDVHAAVGVPDGINPICLGAVPGSLARASIIEHAGSVPTKRPNAHARPLSVWRLADREAAKRWLMEHPDEPDPIPDDKKERRRQLTLPGVA